MTDVERKRTPGAASVADHPWEPIITSSDCARCALPGSQHPPDAPSLRAALPRIVGWAVELQGIQEPSGVRVNARAIEKQARAAFDAAPEQPPDWKEIGHTYGLTSPATGGLDLADAMAYAYKCGLQDEVDNWNVSDERLAEIGRNLRDAFLDAPAAAEGIEIPDHGDEAVPEWDEPICGEKGPGLDNGMYDALCMLPPNHEGEHQHGSVRWQP